MSGIYIPGERIPDTLTAFWIFPDGYVRVFGKNGDEIRGREAIPVPDHGDLIDRDKLEKDIDNYIGGEESRSRFHHWVQVQSVVIPGNKGAET